MFEKSLFWAISTLGITQVKNLSELLAVERHTKPNEKAFHSGPVADAIYADLPIVVQDNIAFIPLRGIMLKSYPWQSSYVCSSYHATLAVRAARTDESITDIVIMADTPGGDTRGMHELGDEIELAAQQKTVTVQVDGILASAGLHVAAGASAIYASHRMNIIGSIGVRTALWDTSEMFEKAGIKVIKIDTGEHKSTGLDGAPVTEEQVQEIQRIVDELYVEFLRTLQSGRKMTEAEAKEVADGRTWFSEDAVKLKLIDGIQPFEQTIAQVRKANPPKARLTRAESTQMFSKFHKLLP